MDLSRRHNLIFRIAGFLLGPAPFLASIEQLVLDPLTLMRPLRVVVLQIFLAHMIHVGFTEDHETVEALLLNRLHEPLDKGIRIWATELIRLHLHSLGAEGFVDCFGEFGVPIALNCGDRQILLPGLVDESL